MHRTRFPHRRRGAVWAAALACLAGPLHAVQLPPPADATGTLSPGSDAAVAAATAPLDATGALLHRIRDHMGATTGAPPPPADPPPESAGAGPPSIGAVARRILGSLAVVVGLLVGAVVLLRIARGRNVGTGQGPVRVISRHPISARSAVVLLEVLDQVLVVGEGDGGLRVLLTVKDPEAIERLRQEPPPGVRAAFAEQFQRLAGIERAPRAVDAEARASARAFAELSETVRRSTLT